MGKEQREASVDAGRLEQKPWGGEGRFMRDTPKTIQEPGDMSEWECGGPAMKQSPGREHVGFSSG